MHANKETAPGTGNSEGGPKREARAVNQQPREVNNVDQESILPERSKPVNSWPDGMPLLGPPPDYWLGAVAEGVQGDSPLTPDTTDASEFIGEDGYLEPSVKALIEVMRARLFIPDDAHIWVAMACALSKHLRTPPLWIMVVGAPSSGKTEILDVLADVSDYQVKDLTVAGLLSWGRGESIEFIDAQGKKRRKRQERPVGILARLGNGRNALVTYTDYSTVLAMADHGRRDDLFAALRTIYDGVYSRDQGRMGHSLEWKGRLTFLAACTQAIDHYSAHNAQLGDRWLYVRTPRLDKEQQKRIRRKALENSRQDDEYTQGVRKTAHDVIQAATGRLDGVVVPEPVMDAIDAVASLARLGRAGVPRERGDITGLPVWEDEPRLIKQLMTLAQCLLALDAGEERTTKLCRRVALDSMPEERRLVLRVLTAHRAELVNTSNIAKLAKLDWKAAKRVLEDLAAIGLVDSEYSGDGQYWDLAEDYHKLVTSLLG
jgi:hypothetical protein